MQKYMSHPKLGGMLVYLDDFDTKLKEGWNFSDVAIVEKEPEIKEVETPEMVYEKKFGKKPHHRMSLNNIIKALEE